MWLKRTDVGNYFLVPFQDTLSCAPTRWKGPPARTALAGMLFSKPANRRRNRRHGRCGWTQARTRRTSGVNTETRNKAPNKIVTNLQEIEAVAGAAAIMTTPRIARKAKIIIHPNMQFVRPRNWPTPFDSSQQPFRAIRSRCPCSSGPPWRKRGSGRSGSRRESDIRCIVNHAESVDLVYLDPPSNSDANYNVLFKEKSEQHSYAQMSCTYLRFVDSIKREFPAVSPTASGPC